MPGDLERNLSQALRDRASSVPHSAMPRLGQAPKRPRPGRLLPVAAAVVAAAGIAGGVVAITPDGDQGAPPAASVVPRPDPDTPQPGEVYYQRSVRGVIGRDDWLDEVEVWQSPVRTGPWRQRAIVGGSVENGRVVPYPDEKPEDTSGTCYPFESAGTVACKQAPSWLSYPSLDFLADAPTKPVPLGRQLRAEAVADAQSLVDDGALPPGEALSPQGIALRELSIVHEVLAANGVPPALRSALRAVVAALPGIKVSENVADPLGRHGTAYSLPEQDAGAGALTVIFDGTTYLGDREQAYVFGVAPGPGEKPSRLLR